jgi:penicillin amidase
MRDGIGSNSWAVSGRLTASGMPILANDPHLAIQMPSIWHQVDLHCQPYNEACPFEVAGFSFPGVPGVIIGHNNDIAWGVTNLGPDVMDLFIEKVNPENPDQYEVNGAWVDFETRTETLDVVGVKPVEITVRLTRHGSVISDAYGRSRMRATQGQEFVPFKERAGIDLPEQYVVAGLDRIETIHTIRARSGPWTRHGISKSSAQLRLISTSRRRTCYMPMKGSIGYQTPGISDPRKGDGRIPVPGRDRVCLTGYIPFDEPLYLKPGGRLYRHRQQGPA